MCSVNLNKAARIDIETAALLSEKQHLIVQSLHGDKDAYKTLLYNIAQYTEKRIGTINITNNKKADLIHAVLISIHRAIHTYDINRNFETWLNAIIDYRLKAKNF